MYPHNPGHEAHNEASPCFSILVPSYNPGRYFRSAIESALTQLGDEDEVVIQDACSSDGTADVIREFEQRDSRVRVVIEKDFGQSDALNRALERAKCDWTIWLNADDVLLPGALDALRGAIKGAPTVDIISGDHQILRAEGEPVDTYRGHELARSYLLKTGCASFSGSIAVRTDILRELGGFRRDLHCTMDYELQFRLVESARPQTHINVPIGALRFHDVSKTGTLWKGFIKESFMLRMANAHTVADRVRGLRGSALQLASIPVFKLRLTPGYRRATRWLRDRSNVAGGH